MLGKTALIFAAGSGSRWASAGYPKQLHKILDVPILYRTVGQLRERGVTPVIVTNDPQISAPGCVDMFAPGATRWLVETILLSEPQWHGRMIGLFGDCCFTHEAMDAICACDEFRFFGREHNSVYTGGCPELFGWTWGPEDTGELLRGLHVGMDHAQQRDPSGTKYDYMTGAIWQPYRAIEGLPIDEHCPVGAHWIRIDDLTDDVDYPHHGMRLAAVWKRHGGVTPKMAR